MKKCNFCLIEKDLEEFPKKGNRCKNCLNNYKKEYAKNNKDKIKKNRKRYYDKNVKTIKEKVKNYELLNTDKIKEYRKDYLKENYDEEKSRKYRLENAESISKYKKEYYELNREKFLKYQSDNKERFNLLRKERNNLYKESLNSVVYVTNKNIEDILYKMELGIRKLISFSFNRFNMKKNTKTIDILGCTITDFKIYIENKFTPKMNWSNYLVYWQLDYIIPITSDRNEKDIYKLNHYTNFQPIYWLEISRKK